VVVPSLNSGEFIAEAIRSALAQEPPPYEVVVQDGGSTDSTHDALIRFGDRVTWRSEPDGGQADALNRAISRARGDWVIWLNADDKLVPGALAAVAHAHQREPSADFFYGDFEVIAADGSRRRRFRSSPYDPARVFTHGCYIFSGAIVWGRALLDRVGPFDPALQGCMDFDYLMRVGQARAVHVGQPVAQFRVTGSQKSSRMRRTFLRESHDIRWRHAGNSRRRKVLTLLLDARDSLYLATHSIRNARAWAALRGERTL
jgi:glycosyltransferase involved in cell wall biosynthesis